MSAECDGSTSYCFRVVASTPIYGKKFKKCATFSLRWFMCVCVDINVKLLLLCMRGSAPETFQLVQGVCSFR